MATEREWRAARSRFVENASGPLRPIRPADGWFLTERPEKGPLVDEFLELSHALFTSPPDAGAVGVLELVVARAQSLVPAADMVSVSVREADGRLETLAESDPLATRADRIQYETGEGPCVEVTAPGSSGFVVSRDLAHDRAYPHFGPQVAELGVTAVCATGLFPGGEAPRLGALNYYFRDPAGLDDVDRDTMLLLAAHAAVALRAARHLEAAALRTSQLAEALETRDVIGQAKGILMERRGTGAPEAFDILRRTSQDLNVKLRELASTIATRRADL